MLTRRTLFTASAALVAAPAIVRVSSLMALSPLPAWRVPDLRDHPGWIVGLDPASLSDLAAFGVVVIRWVRNPQTGFWRAEMAGNAVRLCLTRKSA